MTRTGAFLVAGVLAGCGGGGGSGEYEALFEAPGGGATPDLYGLWGGTIDPGFDARWGLWPDEMVLANRCANKVVGVTVAADVDETQIRVLESAEDGDDSCWVRSMPAALVVCPTDPFEIRDNCFEHDGLSLAVYEGDFAVAEFIKLADSF